MVMCRKKKTKCNNNKYLFNLQVRKSLETLSILIHDKNSPILTDRPTAPENYVSDKDSSPLDIPSFGN